MSSCLSLNITACSASIVWYSCAYEELNTVFEASGLKLTGEALN